jgi:hypothetical protein
MITNRNRKKGMERRDEHSEKRRKKGEGDTLMNNSTAAAHTV